jgi:hypothetical protein
MFKSYYEQTLREHYCMPLNILILGALPFAAMPKNGGTEKDNTTSKVLGWASG